MKYVLLGLFVSAPKAFFGGLWCFFVHSFKGWVKDRHWYHSYDCMICGRKWG